MLVLVHTLTLHTKCSIWDGANARVIVIFVHFTEAGLQQRKRIIIIMGWWARGKHKQAGLLELLGFTPLTSPENPEYLEHCSISAVLIRRRFDGRGLCCLCFGWRTTETRRKHQILKQASSSQHCTFGGSACYEEARQDASKCKAAALPSLPMKFPREIWVIGNRMTMSVILTHQLVWRGALRRVYLLISLRG